MDCSKCGKILDDDARVCDRCGTIFENTEKLSEKQAKSIFSENIDKITEFLDDMTETSSNSDMIKTLLIDKGRELKGFVNEDELRELLADVFSPDEIDVLLPTFFNEVDALGNNICRYQKNIGPSELYFEEEGPVIKSFLRDIIETVKEDILMKSLKDGGNNLKALANQNFDDLAIIKDILASIDIDKNGEITRVEFFEYLCNFFELEVADDYANKFFEEYDSENRGVIPTDLGSSILEEVVAKDEFSIDDVLTTMSKNDDKDEKTVVVEPLESQDGKNKDDLHIEKKAEEVVELLNVKFLSQEETNEEPNLQLYEEDKEENPEDDAPLEEVVELDKIEDALEDLLGTHKKVSDNIDDEFQKVGRSNIENIFDDLDEEIENGGDTVSKGQTLEEVKAEVIQEVRKDLGVDEGYEEKISSSFDSLKSELEGLTGDKSPFDEEDLTEQSDVETDESGFNELEESLKDFDLDDEDDRNNIANNVEEQFEKMKFFKGFDDLDDDKEEKEKAPSFYEEKEKSNSFFDDYSFDEDEVEEVIEDDIEEPIEDDIEESIEDDIEESIEDDIEESIEDEVEESIEDDIEESIEDETLEENKESSNEDDSKDIDQKDVDDEFITIDENFDKLFEESKKDAIEKTKAVEEEEEDFLEEEFLEKDEEESSDDIEESLEEDKEEEAEDHGYADDEFDDFEEDDEEFQEFLSGDSFFDQDELEGVELEVEKSENLTDSTPEKIKKNKQELLNEELENFQDQIDRLGAVEDEELNKFLTGEKEFFDDEELEFTLSKVKKDMVAQQLAERNNQNAIERKEKALGIFKKLFIDVRLEVINMVLLFAIIISVISTLFIFYEPRQDLYYANYSENALIEYERALRRELYIVIGSQEIVSDILYEYMAGDIEYEGARNVLEYHKNLTTSASEFFLNRVYKEASDYTFSLHEFAIESARISERALYALEKNEQSEIPGIIDEYDNLNMKDYNITAKRNDFLIGLGIDSQVDYFEDFFSR